MLCLDGGQKPVEMPVSQPLNATVNGGVGTVNDTHDVPSEAPLTPHATNMNLLQQQQQQQQPPNSLFALAALNHHKFLHSSGLGTAALDFSNLTAPTSSAEASAKLIDYRNHKLASFDIDGRTMICLPQAYDIFLKNLVGGLHTVYTKLKRLDIVPRVCNVEQVRALRSLGAIQPGVNRCKLITSEDFDALYGDCTNSKCHTGGYSTRPGRPPMKRAISNEIGGNLNTNVTPNFLNAIIHANAAPTHKRPKLSTSDDSANSPSSGNSNVLGHPMLATQHFLMQQMIAAQQAAALGGSVANMPNFGDMPPFLAEHLMQSARAQQQSDPLNLSKPPSAKSMNDVMSMLLANAAQRANGTCSPCESGETNLDDDDDDTGEGEEETEEKQGCAVQPVVVVAPVESLEAVKRLSKELVVLREHVASIATLAEHIEEKAGCERDQLVLTLQQERNANAVAQTQLIEMRREKKMFEKRWRHAKRAKEELHAQLMGVIEEKAADATGTSHNVAEAHDTTNETPEGGDGKLEPVTTDEQTDGS